MRRPSFLSAAVLAAAAVSGLKQLTISSLPFDPEVTADCSAAPLAPAFDGSEDGFDEAAPYLAPRCQVEFKWVVLTNHRNGTVDARVDVGGDGVTQGWAVELDFAGVREGGGGRGKALPTRAVAVSNLIGAVELSTSAGVVLIRPRLASGLGTVLLSVRLPRSWPDGRPPAIRCVREDYLQAAGGQGGAAEAEAVTEAEAEEAWLGRAREDYSWMADEFNRQYHNSHGKSHDEYQPSSADSELQLHFLNGRLWCFYGAVHNATRSLRQAVALDPEHLLSHLLLAKVYIGQGFHRQAITQPQPSPWPSPPLALALAPAPTPAPTLAIALHPSPFTLISSPWPWPSSHLCLPSLARRCVPLTRRPASSLTTGRATSCASSSSGGSAGCTRRRPRCHTRSLAKSCTKPATGRAAPRPLSGSAGRVACSSTLQTPPPSPPPPSPPPPAPPPPAPPPPLPPPPPGRRRRR